MGKIVYKDLIKKLNKRAFSPVYLLHGNEPFYLEKISEKFLDSVIPSHEKGFNEFVLYGKDCTIGTILSYTRKFPMMAEYQLVIIKDAESIEDINKKEALNLLEDYMLSPLASTILVLCFNSTVDERKSWVKTAIDRGEVFSSKPLYDSDLPDFVVNYCYDKNIKISQNSVHLLIEHIGNDLKRISKEIDKIVINLPVNQEINEDIVSKFVGISKEFNVFELQKALANRNLAKSFQIVNFFSSNTKQYPIQATLIMLYNYFSKVLLVKMSKQNDNELAKEIGVNSYFLKDYKIAVKNFQLSQLIYALKVIRNFDAKSKGVGSSNESDKDIYNELIIQLLLTK